VTLALVLLLAAFTAQGQPAESLERAKAHFRAGEALYQLGSYSEALREFKAGFELAPRPMFLLNIGQAYRKLGDAAAALDAFEKYLVNSSADDPQRRAVEELIAELRRAPASAQQSLPAPSSVAPRAAAAEASARSAPHRRWYRDWIGGLLVGVGVGGIAVGGALFGHGNSVIGSAQQDLYHHDLARSALPERTAGIVVLAAGGTLVLGGVIRYALRARSPR
jgi:tetratricopeptide (TPR) repeat protein